MRFYHGNGLYKINVDDEILALQKLDGNSGPPTIIKIKGSKNGMVI